MTEKVTIKITIDKKLHDEFIQNSIDFFGYKRSHRRDTIEMAMRITNNYFKSYEDNRLIDIANYNNIPPYELGNLIIKRFISLHKDMGVKINMISDEEHEKEVLKYLEKRKP